MGPTFVKQPFLNVYVSKLARRGMGEGWVLTFQFYLLMNGCLFSLDFTFHLVHGLTLTNFNMNAAGIVAQCSFIPRIIYGFRVEKINIGCKL